MLALVLVLGGGSVVWAANILSNGSFEGSGSGSLTGWVGSSATLTLATDATDGKFAARVAAKGTAKSYSTYVYPRPTVAAAGTLYAASAWVRSDTPGKTVCLRIRELTPSGSQVSAGQKCLTAQVLWQPLSGLSLTGKTAGDAMALVVSQSSASTGTSFEIDGVVLDATTPTPPPVPSAPVATAVSAYRVDLSWTESPATNVAGYTVYRNGSAISTVSDASTTSYSDTTVTPNTSYTYTVDAIGTTGLHSGQSNPTSVQTPSDTGGQFTTPIRHVVVIDEENHSFDNVLGQWCLQQARCDGATNGVLSNGTPIPLAPATDIVPSVDHGVAGQVKAVDGGRMDHFDQISGCRSTDTPAYACFTEFDPSQIPNATSLASTFAISDRTFSQDLTPSFGAHLELVSSTLDGFTGANPTKATDHAPGPGWGCNSFKVTNWRASLTAPLQLVPACVPAQDGSGPYKPSPVQWVPTIMDRMDAAGLGWRIYAAGEGAANPAGDLPYGWAICPTFADCINTSEATNMVDSSKILTDAANGTLPNLSLVMPTQANSQHNNDSMAQGDNWIGSIVNAIEQSPQWTSTAIFITWDDCGCFYDHVPPPPGLGIRVPMLLVSPYAKAGYTDSATASFASILAYTEHAFSLAPLSTADANAYDYANTFDYTQQPLTNALHPVHTPISQRERRWIKQHPPDPHDPT